MPAIPQLPARPPEYRSEIWPRMEDRMHISELLNQRMFPCNLVGEHKRAEAGSSQPTQSRSTNWRLISASLRLQRVQNAPVRGESGYPIQRPVPSTLLPPPLARPLARPPGLRPPPGLEWEPPRAHSNNHPGQSTAGDAPRPSEAPGNIWTGLVIPGTRHSSLAEISRISSPTVWKASSPTSLKSTQPGKPPTILSQASTRTNN